jgi:3-phenylpropionate/trans-cinnamate dioxygenase ferredoxin subunit
MPSDTLAGFVPAATTHEIPPGGRKSLNLEGRQILLVRIQDQFFAVEDVCTHDSQPLTDGAIENGSVACPRHGARFDLKTGQALCMPAVEPVPVLDVRIEGDTVFVRPW